LDEGRLIVQNKVFKMEQTTVPRADASNALHFISIALANSAIS